MSNEKFATMLERIEQKLGVFITNGATTGFKFDGKCADRLSDIREDIVYMFDNMQDEIDVLNDVAQHAQFQHNNQKHKVDLLTREVQSLRNITDAMSAKTWDERL